MKPILAAVVVFALAVGGRPGHVAVCTAAENPDPGRRREFRVVRADLAVFQRRLADAAAEVEIGKLRVARWQLLSERCGGCYRDELAVAKEELRLAEMVLDKLRADLRRFPLEPTAPAAKRGNQEVPK
jgi:hypothetical protein